MTQKISVWRICKNLNQLKDNNFKPHFHATSSFFLNKKKPSESEANFIRQIRGFKQKGGGQKEGRGVTLIGHLLIS